MRHVCVINIQRERESDINVLGLYTQREMDIQRVRRAEVRTMPDLDLSIHVYMRFLTMRTTYPNPERAWRTRP